MNNDLYIRKFNKKDIDIVMKIWYNSNVDTYNFIDKSYFNEIKEKVRNKFLKSDIYVYDENNIIKAFILIDNSYIDELYVSKEYRSNGIGKKLLNFIKSNQNKLMLNVFQKNTIAIEFYKSNGFKIIEENIEDNTKEKGYLMMWEK